MSIVALAFALYQAMDHPNAEETGQVFVVMASELKYPKEKILEIISDSMMRSKKESAIAFVQSVFQGEG